MLNLARATVYEKTSLKLLPHYKKGKKIMFKRSELLEWIESGKVDTMIDSRRLAIEYMQSRSRKK
jgi:excisionase family DNA binding protein